MNDGEGEVLVGLSGVEGGSQCKVQLNDKVFQWAWEGGGWLSSSLSFVRSFVRACVRSFVGER